MRKGKRKELDGQDEHLSLRERIRKLEIINAELQDSEKRLRILFEHAPDGYYLSDTKGVFVDGNAAAEAMTGYTRDELIGKNFLHLKLLSPHALPRATALLVKSLAGQSTGPDEFTLNRKDGTQVCIETRTHPIKTSGQSLILGLARDITERKQAEATLRENERTLRESQEIAKIGQGRLDLLNDHLDWSKGIYDLFEVDPDGFDATYDALGCFLSCQRELPLPMRYDATPVIM